MATTARVGVDIVGTDKTRAAFASAQGGLGAFNRSLNQIKITMAGLAGGNLLAGFTRSMVGINREVPVVKQAMDTLTASWGAFGRKVGDAGLNAALVNFATRMSGLITGTDGLSKSIGGFMAGAVNLMAGVFEGVGRAIAFVYDNLAAFGRLAKVVTLFGLSFWLLQTGQNLLLFHRSLISVGKSLLAFNTIQGKTKGAFIAIATVVALAVGATDEMNAVFDTIWKKIEGTLPSIGNMMAGVIGDLGLDTTALTKEFQTAGIALGVLPRDAVVVTEKLANLGKGAKTAAADVASASFYMQDFVDTMKPLNDTLQQVGQTFSSEFSQAFSSIIDGSKSAKAAFADMAKGILNSLTSMAVNNLFSGIFGGPSGGGGVLSGIFGGARAMGGPVSPGKAYMVGEKGPELFSPGSSGTIIPNASLGGGSTIHIHNTVNAPGAEAAGLAAVRAQLAKMQADMPRAIKAVVAGEKRLQPRFAT